MGNCCCCASRRPEIIRAPIYYYCPQDVDDENVYSTAHGTPSAVSVGVLVDTNLDTSTPDTYRAPPTPVPYDMGSIGRRRSSTEYENLNNKSGQLQQFDTESVEDAIVGNGFENGSPGAVVKGSELKDISHKDDTKKGQEIMKLNELEDPAKEEEDVCPICLEEYDLENPSMVTKCEHHFHLSCILEWMERSDTCPMCDQRKKQKLY